MTLRIRPAAQADLAALDARSYPRLLKADYPPSVLVTALPLISKANPRLIASGTYYLAEGEDGAVLGAGGWTRTRRAGQGEIRHVVTDDRHLRQGIGRALLTHVLRSAEGCGITRLVCNATFTAVPFYRALGFTEIHSVDVSLAPGITFPAMLMERAARR